MKNFFILFLVLFSLKSFSQRQYIGFQGSLARTNMCDTLLNSRVLAKTGFNFGFNYSYTIKHHFRIGFDALYQQQGYSNEFYITDYYSGEILKTLELPVRHNYLTTPIKAGLTFGYKTKLVLNFGIAPSIMLYANRRRLITPIYDIDALEFEKVPHTEYVKRFDLAVLAEIAIEQRVGKELYLSPSFSFRQSVTKFDKIPSVDAYEGKYRHYGFFFGFGLRKRLIR